MKNLLNFLIKYNYWFLFIILEVISFVLLARFNNYQGSTIFTSTNQLVGSIYSFSGNVKSYFHLKSVNSDLLDKNIILEQQVAELERKLAETNVDSLIVNQLKSNVLNDYNIINANIVNNTVNRINNYITLDKGTDQGVKNEMGVVSGNGIVGIVYMTSSNYSIVISVLNSKSNISCKIKNSDYFGYLRWEGREPQYAYVKDLPRHAAFALGDTIVTSGYSAVFPQGVMIGTIDDMQDSKDGLSYLLKIKLATDFSKLSEVAVISKENYLEQKELERKADK